MILQNNTTQQPYKNGFLYAAPQSETEDIQVPLRPLENEPDRSDIYSDGGNLKTGNRAAYIAKLMVAAGYTAKDLEAMKTFARGVNIVSNYDGPRLQWRLDKNGNAVRGRADRGFIRRFEDGGDTYNGGRMTIDNHTGTRYEAKRQEYIKKKLDEMRLQALENSRNRTYPEVPLMERRPDGSYKYGLSCIYTALSNYGKKYRVAGNEQFRGNPEAYGFIALDDVKDALPGDFIQAGMFAPDLGNVHAYHGMILDHMDDHGRMFLNYSNGTRDPKDTAGIRKNANYFSGPVDNYTAKAYRFVGLPEDLETWNQEYDANYSPLQVLPRISLDLPMPVLQPPDPGIAK